MYSCRDLLLPVGRRGALEDLDLRRQGQRRVVAADFVGVAAGVGEHLFDVPVGVVVGEDRAPDVLGHAGGVEVAGGGVDRVFGVVRVRDPVAVGVDPVHRPGFRHELHPADGAGVGGTEVAAEGGLDRVDPGQDRRALRAEPVAVGGGLVDRDQDRRHAADRAGSSSGSEGIVKTPAPGAGGRRRPSVLLRSLPFPRLRLGSVFAGVDAAARRRRLRRRGGRRDQGRRFP